MPIDRFLTVAVNLLNTALLEASRTDAKRIYRELEQGKDVTITHLEMEDKSLVRVDLGLDHRRYQGDLTFSSFRTGVASLLSNAVKALEEPEKLKTYRSEDDPNAVLFGFMAITAQYGKPSVLVLGSETGGGKALIRLGLTYLDHVQFEDQLPDDSGLEDLTEV